VLVGCTGISFGHGSARAGARLDVVVWGYSTMGVWSGSRLFSDESAWRNLDERRLTATCLRAPAAGDARCVTTATRPPGAQVETGRIGLLLGSALYVAAVLGTGILLLPTLAVRAAGPASLLAVAGVLAVSVPLAATFAALATRHPDSGGVATYVRLALGPTSARATGYWFFFGVCVGHRSWHSSAPSTSWRCSAGRSCRSTWWAPCSCCRRS